MDGDQLWTYLKPVVKDNNSDKEKDKLIDILMPCIIEQLIKPRYKMIVLLEYLFKGLKDSENFDKDVFILIDCLIVLPGQRSGFFSRPGRS